MATTRYRLFLSYPVVFHPRWRVWQVNSPTKFLRIMSLWHRRRCTMKVVHWKKSQRWVESGIRIQGVL